METTIKKTTETTAEKTTNSKSDSRQLAQQIPIEGTPYTAVKMDDKWFLTMGRYRLTNQLGSLEECEAEAQDTSIMRIMQIIKIMIEEHDKQEEIKYGKKITQEEAKKIIRNATATKTNKPKN